MKGTKNRLAAALALVLGACLLALGGYGVLSAIDWHKMDAVRGRLAQAVSQAAGGAQSGGEARLEGYAALQGENPDLAGWVRIEGTAIDYPVMFTPQDPEYYLRRGFDGGYSMAGLPFIDGGCDLEQGASLIVYGHNMSDGSMFAALHSYLDPAFLREHPEVRFDTLAQQGVYQVLSVLKFDLTQENLADYYALPATREEFERYVGFVTEQSAVETGVRAEWGDRLLVLSTCSEHASNGRVMVVARKTAG